MSNFLPLWLGLIVLVFVIVLAVQLVGARRAKKSESTQQIDNTHPDAHIDLKDKNVAERLGVPSASETGVDPRGEDVGGNFWEAPKKDEQTRK